MYHLVRILAILLPTRNLIESVRVNFLKKRTDRQHFFIADENKTPIKVVAQKHGILSPMSAKGTSGSARKREKAPIPKTVCTGVGKYRPIQVIGGTHSAKGLSIINLFFLHVEK